MTRRLWAVAVIIAAVVTLAVPRGAPAASVLDEGIRLYEAGEYARALPLLQRAAKVEPRNARAWTWLGATHLKLDRVTEARDALERAVLLAPQSPAAHFYLGLVYARLGETKRAQAAFQRVLALEQSGGGYAQAAAEWLRTLTSAAGPPPASVPAGTSAPVAAGASCPRPVPFPIPQPPATVRPRGVAVEISDLEMDVDKEDLVVIGEVENGGEDDVTDIRIQATGFGLNGREVARAVTTIRGPVETDDFGDFLLKLGTKPPPIWVKVEILEYTRRRRSEALDVMLVPVPLENYAGLARTRVRAAATALPAGPSRRHTVCLSIADSAGFPLMSIRVKVALSGSTPGRTIQQIQSAEVTGQGTAFQVEWTHDVRIAFTLEVESVTFAALPRGR